MEGKAQTGNGSNHQLGNKVNPANDEPI